MLKLGSFGSRGFPDIFPAIALHCLRLGFNLGFHRLRFSGFGSASFGFSGSRFCGCGFFGFGFSGSLFQSCAVQCAFRSSLGFETGLILLLGARREFIGTCTDHCGLMLDPRQFLPWKPRRGGSNHTMLTVWKLNNKRVARRKKIVGWFDSQDPVE